MNSLEARKAKEARAKAVLMVVAVTGCAVKDAEALVEALVEAR